MFEWLKLYLSILSETQNYEIEIRDGLHDEDGLIGSKVIPIISRCAMLLNAQISGILACKYKLTHAFVVQIELGALLNSGFLRYKTSFKFKHTM